MNKVLLLILDGWGIGAPDLLHNAVYKVRPQYWQKLLEDFPNTVLSAREDSVGLSKGHLSNSEVGHTAIGAGRVVPQSAYAIDRAIEGGSFFDNPELEKVHAHLQAHGSVLHLAGMLSNGGVHAHINHLLALLEWAKKRGVQTIALHLFLDGRDMAPMSALPLLAALAPYLDEHTHIATVCGRAIGMDRTENWDRTTAFVETMTQGKNTVAESVHAFIERNYSEGITDEFMAPARFASTAVQENDAVVFFNFRADRMRQLVRLFLQRAPGAVQSTISVPKNLFLASAANYDDTFENVSVLFPKTVPKNNLGEWVSAQGLKQLRLAETEKEAHVTYFVNGGQDVQYPREERLVVPSLGLKNYAPEPQMSLPLLTQSLVRALSDAHFDFLVCNIANGDMVGHSGDFHAGVKAVLEVDAALAKIIPAAQEHGYTVILTADHGNIEYMVHDGSPHTAHTFNDVPLLVTNPNIRLRPHGHLHEAAPTVLDLMGIPRPKEMTSQSLRKGAQDEIHR